MFDIAVLTAGAQTPKKATETFQELGKMDLYERILELRGHLAAATEEIIELRVKLREVQDRADTQVKLMLVGGTYVVDGDRSHRICTGCWDGPSKIKARLHHRHGDRFFCPVCGLHFDGENPESDIPMGIE